MNNVKNKDSDTKKIIIVLVLVFTLMFCTTGATYVYLLLSKFNDKSDIVIGNDGFNLSVTDVSFKSDTNGVMVPIKESLLSSVMNDTNKCVDSNNNIVCKVYAIDIYTNSTTPIPAVGTIIFTNPSENLKWKLVSDKYTVGNVGTMTDATTFAMPFATPTFTSVNKKFTYYMIIWINENGSERIDSGSWSAIISFNTSDGISITSKIIGGK